MSAVLDDVIATARLVPLAEAVEVNPKIDRTALHDDLFHFYFINEVIR